MKQLKQTSGLKKHAIRNDRGFKGFSQFGGDKKRRLTTVLGALLALAALLPFLVTDQGSLEAASPYVTWTEGQGGQLVVTQTAYEATQVLQIDMRAAEDLHVTEDGLFYIADTGNQRILVVDGNSQYSIGEGVLEQPTGVFARDDRVYVADYRKQAVYVFSRDGELLQEILRPEEPLFGLSTRFLPRKVTADARGNIYVVSEGSVNGVMQLSADGSFAGYVGSNQAQVSPLQLLQRRLFTEEQLSRLFRSVPPSPTGITIDGRGLIYTATYGLGPTQAIKKFNVAGQNLFESTMWYASNQLEDISVTSAGNLIALDSSGFIYEFDTYGNLIFMFGGRATGLERFGVLSDPVAIEVDDHFNLYVLDAGKNVIQVYRPTDFASELHAGLEYFREGLYVEGEPYWENILRLNSSFSMSYLALANANFKQGNAREALEMYEQAENRDGYSDAFWEIRNDWLMANLGIVILVLIALSAAWIILKRLDKKQEIFNPLRRGWKQVRRVRILDELIYMTYWIRHPIDASYEMKRNRRVGVLPAVLIILIVMALQISDVYVKSYLFRWLSVYDTNILNEILVVVIPFALFIGSNYLVATIKDGEGHFKDVFRLTAYSLSPYALFMLPLQILTNALTYNEAFVYDFLYLLIIIWCVVLLVTSLMEVHNYSFREVVANLLLTVFTMAILIIIFVVVYLLISQEVDFLRSIIEEVLLRVQYR